MVTDELSVSPADMEAAAESAVAETEAEQSIEASDPATELEDTVNPDNEEFWGEGEDEVFSEEASAEGEDLELSEDAPSPDGETITYKANGKDVTLNLDELRNDPKAREELAKKLALLDGARKAFSDKNKLRQQIKKQEASAKELENYRSSWDKLEAIKDDPAKLYEVLTGVKFDEMLAQQLEQRSAYQNATEEERTIMDYEQRMAAMEAKVRRDEDLRSSQLKEAEAAKYEADKKFTQTKMEREFFKYEFSDDSPAEANRLKKMLWRSSLGDIQDYRKQGYKMSDKMIAKAFRDNAKALQSFYTKSVDDGVKKAVTAKKSVAKEKAAEIATKNYSDNSFSDKLVSKDPMSIFRSFQKGRRK